MNDELLKNGGKSNYFEELLACIRDIRSSEKVFWAKVLDIYATSIQIKNSKFFINLELFNILKKGI